MILSSSCHQSPREGHCSTLSSSGSSATRNNLLICHACSSYIISLINCNFSTISRISRQIKSDRIKVTLGKLCWSVLSSFYLHSPHFSADGNFEVTLATKATLHSTGEVGHMREQSTFSDCIVIIFAKCC